MQDAYLTAVAAMANCNILTDKPFGVTLLVDGLLVTGLVVSRQAWLAHNSALGILEKMFVEQDKKSGDGNWAQQADSDADYIHLREAKYFTPGALPVASEDGLFVRVRVESVSAFHLGQLSPIVR